MNECVTSEDLTERYNFWVRLAAFSAVTMAVILVIIKLYAWLMTDASSMLASSTDSMLDLFASVMNAIILKYALAPADEEHRFGHGKAESLAGLVQSAFVLGSAILLLIHGVQRLVSPQAVLNTSTGVWVTIVSIILTLALVSIQKYAIYKTQSVAISADALHYQSDLLLNLGVLAALLLNNQYWPQADGFFTVVVGIFLMWGAGRIIYISVQHLMDHELDEKEIKLIYETVNDNPNALGCHELRTRQSGPQKFIQFHLELADDLSLKRAHQIGEEIELELNALFSPCEVFIHHDPSSVVSKDNPSEFAINKKV